MKKLICGLAALLALAVPAVAAEAPTKDKDGNYWQRGDVLSYAADAVTQQCYVVRTNVGGIESLPCEVLARRPEWKPLLTWVK